MDTQVHKCTEVRYIRNGTLEFHPFSQIGYLLYVFAEFGDDKFIPRVPSRFQQLFTNIAERVPARVSLKRFEIEFVNLNRVLQQFTHWNTQRGGHSFNYRIRFGMYGGAIQGILSVFKAEKPCSLFKNLIAESLYLPHLFARNKCTMLIPISDEALRQFVTDARNIFQKIDRGRIQVHTDAIDTRFDRGFQAAFQFLLVNIMLVLTDTDRFGIDLHQFR